LRFEGELIQVDASPERIGATYAARPLIADVRLTLQALLDELGGHTPAAADASARVSALRARIHAGLEAQGRATEIGLLRTIERVLPDDAITAWDMTILAYWAAPHLPLKTGQQFHYPLGSGTLGYAWPAAIGASIANPDRPVLGVVGDGGLQYALAEVGAAAAHGVGAKLLVVDDGGYGILREYQRDEFGEESAVELGHIDIAAVARASGVPVVTATPDDLDRQLSWALAQRGPAVVVLRERIAAAAPTP
jgi:acetolactate synthase I/II/III large subunit